MSLFLLLKDDNGVGKAEALLPECSKSGIAAPLRTGPPGRKFRFELEPDAEDDLHRSAQHGGGLAYELLWREGYLRQEISVHFRFDVLPLNVLGHSGDLLFALAVVKAALFHKPGGYPPIAATGALNEQGQVLAVAGVPAKLHAALRQMPEGGLWFYPEANAAEIDAGLRETAQRQGIALHPVRRLDDAVKALGIPIREIYLDTPYRGLEAFESEHRAIYFGRQAEIALLRERLLAREHESKPGLLIIAPSGAGKSSLVKAGLLPALALGPQALPGKPLLCGAWRPSAAGQDGGEATLAASLRAAWVAQCPALAGLAESATLAGLADSLADLLPAQHRFLFLLDPLEEVFTHNLPADTLGAWLLRLQAEGVWVLALLRSDFYEAYAREPTLLKAFGDSGSYTLPPLEATALDEIITGPARLARVEFETQPDSGENLAHRLRADMAGQADALPLLEFALTGLYEARTENRMTFASYAAQGKLRGAIGKRAENLFANLSHTAQASLPRLLWALTATAPSSANRRFAARPAALADFSAGTPPRELIDAFVKARLLVTGGGDASGASWLRVAHEALLYWERAAQEIQQFLRDLELHERLCALAAVWQAEPDNPSRLLPPGTPLREAEDLLARRGEMLAPAVAAWVEASSRAEWARLDAEQARQQAELKAQRRQTRIAWAVSVAFGVLVYLVYQRQQEANYHRDEAEKLIRFMLFDFREKLLPLGRLDLLNDVSKRAEKYFNEHIEMRLTFQFNTVYEQAVSYGQEGDVLVSQGDLTTALEKYQKSVKIMLFLLEENPEKPRLRRELAVNRARVGNVLFFQGDLLGALKEYQYFMEISQTLATEMPTDIERQDDLSVGHVKIGEILTKKGDLSGAMAEYKEALKILKKLAIKDPDKDEFNYGLSIIHAKIGEIMQEQGDLLGAWKEYNQAMETSKVLLAKDPSNANWQRLISAIHTNIGLILFRQGDLSKALAEYKQATDIHQALVAKDPGNADWQRDLLVIHKLVGELLVKQDDWSWGLSEYRQGLAISQALTERDPSNEIWQYDLSEIHSKIGRILFLHGDWHEALDEFHKADAILDRLPNGVQNEAANRKNLRVSIKGGLSFLALFDKQYKESLAAAKSALEIQKDLSIVSIRQAHALLFLNRFEEAKAIYLKQPNQVVQDDGETFRLVVLILDDFKAFRKHGLKHPDMAKIEKLLGSAPAQTAR